jgi:hypothetical protein
MARTQQHPPRRFAPALVLALASCAGGGRGVFPEAAAVTESVRRIVARVTGDGGAPYAPPADGGDAFGRAPGGPFEGADAPGLVGPPSGDDGAFGRAGACDALCSFVAACYAADVPRDCAASCSEQVRSAARQLGDACAGPVAALYACVAESLVCERAGAGGRPAGDRGDENEGGVVLAPEAASRCGAALAELRVCSNRPDIELGDLLDD